jgi:adenylate cyclase
MTIGPSELEAAGLYDPSDENAAQRLELLHLLLDLGVTARIFSEADVEVLQNFRAAQQLFPEEVIVQLGRVIGATLARLADAAVSAFVVNVGAPSLASDPTGLAVARANVTAAELLPALLLAMEVTLRHHLELARRPLVFADEDVQGVETQRLAVGFVDLVESTALAQQLSIGELGTVLGQFEGKAADAVAARGGRLVKLIGDEAMFVIADPAVACEIALTVLEQVTVSSNLEGARGGVAVGNVVTRDGDVFGPVVNLAARAVKLADPGTLAVATEVRDSVGAQSGLRFTSLGPHALKGFDREVELHAVTR